MLEKILEHDNEEFLKTIATRKHLNLIFIAQCTLQMFLDTDKKHDDVVMKYLHAHARAAHLLGRRGPNADDHSLTAE